MTIFGLTTQKTSPLNEKFNNRYWVNANIMADVQVLAGTIIDLEQLCFGATVGWNNTHVWLPNSEPNQFSNQPRNEFGGVASATPVSDVICAELLFGTENSYIHSKKFRVQVNSTYLNGTFWSLDMLGLLGDVAEGFSELLDVLTTVDGSPLTSVSINPKYVFQQRSKRWYNRAST